MTLTAHDSSLDARTARGLAGSVGLHGAMLLAGLALATHPRATDPSALEVALMEVVPLARPAPVVAPHPTPPVAPTPVVHTRASRVARSPAPSASRAAPVLVAQTSPVNAGVAVGTDPAPVDVFEPIRDGSRSGGHPTTSGAEPESPTPAVIPAVDHSRAATVRCDAQALGEFFPDDARESGVTTAHVRLRITVDASGAVSEVRALNDPSYGFAPAAVRALREGCVVTPARDRTGSAVGSTFEFPFRFQLD